ncbi:hypothetical protein WAE58_22120 [Pedobacter panaciterrae]|uniref:Uncharacterized protein n=1 Tax=Pedobacter panaciterrae TaxID=363849 RepID=A0ABU8NSB3_9SPHI
MAKNQFKFKLKITGFELEVEGSKEDVAAITSSVTNQIKGLTSPQFLGDNSETEDADTMEVSLPQLSSPQKKKSTRKKIPSNGSSGNQKVEVIDFKNDPKKYSTPLMTWNKQQKALWLLYVIKSEKNVTELTVTQIVNTFNTHYKQSKTINSGNVARDLGKVKLGNGALVGEDATSSPRRWYLTDAGDSSVQNLIKDSKK